MGSGRNFWHVLFVEFRLRFIQYILNYILPHVIHTAFAIYSSQLIQLPPALQQTHPCVLVLPTLFELRGGRFFVACSAGFSPFCDSFFFFFFTRKKGGDPGPPAPSGPYQASYIETDSFVKILIKHAVCSCSRFLRHYYQRIIRGLVL